MRKKYYIIYILFLLNGSLISDDWELITRESHIKIWNRNVPNAPIKEFKGEILISQPIEVLGSVLLDIENHNLWVPNCKQSKIIKKINEFNFIQYYIMDYPWPVEDRDVYIESHTSIDFNQKTIMIHSQAIQNYPLVNNKIRIQNLKSSWILKQINENTTLVIYQSFVHPAGSIPISLANYFSKYMPYNILTNLEKISKEEKYQILGKKLYNQLLKKE